MPLQSSPVLGETVELFTRSIQLIEPLGTGDIATVYRAVDSEEGGRHVVAAVVHPDLDNTEEVVQVLQSRIALVEDLVHPGVISQEGVFSVAGRPALVQEIVPGVDLVRLAKLGPVPLPIASAVIREAALVLDALSENGLAHGFLSPRRTLLTVSGQIKLAGFGAKAGTALVSDPLDAIDRGRMRYTAPERLGGVIDHPGDVYALGAMCSLLLTGTWPKRPGQNQEDQLAVAADTAERIRALEVESIEVVAGLVQKCLDFQSSARPGLAELAMDLGEFSASADEVQALSLIHISEPTRPY